MWQDKHFSRFSWRFQHLLSTILLTKSRGEIVDNYEGGNFEFRYIFCPFTKLNLNRNGFCPILGTLVF